MRVIGGKFKGKKLIEPRDKVHEYIKKLDWSGGFYRKDIGFKVID